MRFASWVSPKRALRQTHSSRANRQVFFGQRMGLPLQTLPFPEVEPETIRCCLRESASHPLMKTMDLAHGGAVGNRIAHTLDQTAP